MYNSSEGYVQIKKELGKMLAGAGFRRYKTVTWYRVTHGDILQFINFQKGDQWLSDKMTINIAVQPLYSPGCSFGILAPGGRLGLLLTPAKDHWWLCNSETSTEASITELKNIIVNDLIPFFDNTANAEQLYHNFHDNSFRYFWANSYDFITKGYICLKTKQYKEAINIFEANRPSQVAKFKTIKNFIEKEQFAEVDKILDNNVFHSKDKLKI
ncbi:MAG TPA: DUF4304 domain-containing protein [Mucilaginibacter sp.]|jgi:hypothetical protein|nr:DUF4304 domain-containing protein [Mucilaginibacter sp.]